MEEKLVISVKVLLEHYSKNISDMLVDWIRLIKFIYYFFICGVDIISAIER